MLNKNLRTLNIGIPWRDVEDSVPDHRNRAYTAIK